MPKDRWVIKFGTGILTRSDGRLDPQQFQKLTADISQLVKHKTEIILVSSGAVGAGMRLLGLNKRPTNLAELQACATIGQAQLVAEYEKRLAKQGFHAAQMLLTLADLDSRVRYKNARATLDHLLRLGSILPIINENDALSTEEIRVGDNDRLSAHVAVMAGASKLVILSNVEGLLRNPEDGCSVIPLVKKIDKDLEALSSGQVGQRSVGGMATKLQAARIAAQSGIPTIIANGRRQGVLQSLLNGEKIGTKFQLKKTPLPRTKK